MTQPPSPPRRRINSWLQAHQSVWDEMALDHTGYDAWFRVWALAVARAQANGHAPFAPNEIAKVLGRLDEAGSWVPKSPSGVSQAISLAKRKRLLDTSSTARCLVLPPHAWRGGLGSPTKNCPVHG